MARLSDDQLSKYVDQLMQLVAKLPLKQEGKDYLQAQIIIDAYDVWQFDDENNTFSLEEYLADPQNPQYNNVKATYGIENISQWKRYATTFVNKLKKVRTAYLEKYLDSLDKLTPQEKSIAISKQLEKFNKADLFHKYGITEIRDPEWNEQVKDILSNKMKFAKEQAFYLTNTEIPVREPDQNDDTVYIVEELEDWMAWEGVRYVKKTENFGSENRFDPGYFGRFIATDLAKRMEEFILGKIRPLNQYEVNKYLALSAKQFDTFTPPKRHKAFQLKFHDAYWYPNPMPYKENETWQNRYSNHFWKHYTRNFEFLKESFMSLYRTFYSNFSQLNSNGGNNTANIQLQKFLKLIENENPLNESPLKYYHDWENSLQELKIEILDNLSLLRSENKQDYLEKVSLSLQKFSNRNYVQKQVYLGLLIEYDLNTMDVLTSDNIDNELISAIRSNAIIFDDSMPPNYYESINDLQHTFYNYHLGRIVNDAATFTQNKIQGLSENVSTKHELTEIDPESIEVSFIKEMYGDGFMPKSLNIATDALYRALSTLPVKLHKSKTPADNYFRWQNLKRELDWEVSSNLLKLQSVFDKKIYLSKLIAEFTDWTFYKEYDKELIDEWELEYGQNFINAIRSSERDNDFVKQMRRPFSDLDTGGLEWEELKKIKDIRENVNNYMFLSFVNHCLVFLNKYKSDLEMISESKLPGDNAACIVTFESAISHEKQKYILQILEDLGLTNNGRSLITERKKSALRGVAEALIESNILSALSLEKSYRLIAEKIGLALSSKLDYTNTSIDFKKKADQYIKDHPFK